MVTLVRRRKQPFLSWLLGLAIFVAAIAVAWVGSWLIIASKEAIVSNLVDEKKRSTASSVSLLKFNGTKDKTASYPKIAHVISLVNCNKASRVKGFLDALVILRHSIHQNSVHAHPNSTYSYQMYAIIHKDGGCVQYVALLRRLGYISLVRSTPVDITSIRNNWYRTHVDHENCCGSHEFIKLYAYTLIQHPVVVHWDLDTAVLQPLDELFDAIVFDKDSIRGRTARARIAIQRPQSQPWPDRVDAFFTRDVTSSQPDERVQAVQGGFVVMRPGMEHFQLYQSFIQEANYSPGRGPTSGWGGMGYGGFQGAMAYQGVLAYYYDQVYPGHAVELDVCRWNQVVADVIWRGPNKRKHLGQCRQYPVNNDFENNTPEKGQCEDCRILPLEETKTVHFTVRNEDMGSKQVCMNIVD